MSLWMHWTLEWWRHFSSIQSVQTQNAFQCTILRGTFTTACDYFVRAVIASLCIECGVFASTNDHSHEQCVTKCALHAVYCTTVYSFQLNKLCQWKSYHAPYSHKYDSYYAVTNFLLLLLLLFFLNFISILTAIRWIYDCLVDLYFVRIKLSEMRWNDGWACWGWSRGHGQWSQMRRMRETVSIFI